MSLRIYVLAYVCERMTFPLLTFLLRSIFWTGEEERRDIDVVGRFANVEACQWRGEINV